jgi:hypothetical protein
MEPIFFKAKLAEGKTVKVVEFVVVLTVSIIGTKHSAAWGFG